MLLQIFSSAATMIGPDNPDADDTASALYKTPRPGKTFRSPEMRRRIIVGAEKNPYRA
jgi:hypothetical protein